MTPDLSEHPETPSESPDPVPEGFVLMSRVDAALLETYRALGTPEELTALRARVEELREFKASAQQAEVDAAVRLGNDLMCASKQVCREQTSLIQQAKDVWVLPKSKRLPATEFRSALCAVSLEDLVERGKWLGSEAEAVEKAIGEVQNRLATDLPGSLPTLAEATRAVAHARRVVTSIQQLSRGLMILAET